MSANVYPIDRSQKVFIAHTSENAIAYATALTNAGHCYVATYGQTVTEPKIEIWAFERTN